MFTSKSQEEREKEREQRKKEWDELFDKAWDGTAEVLDKGAKAMFVAGFLGAVAGGAVVAVLLYFTLG